MIEVVSELPGDKLDVDALRDQQAGVGVAQVKEAQPWLVWRSRPAFLTAVWRPRVRTTSTQDKHRLACRADESVLGVFGEPARLAREVHRI